MVYHEPSLQTEKEKCRGPENLRTAPLVPSIQDLERRLVSDVESRCKKPIQVSFALDEIIDGIVDDLRDVQQNGAVQGARAA